MAHATMQRPELLQRLADVFRNHGYDGASLKRLAEATGLVKASLYYQFPNGKEDMAAAVLGAIGAEIDRAVLQPLRETDLPPEARVAAMAEGLEQVYDDGKSFCLIDVFGIGEAGRIHRAHLAQTVATIVTAIASFLQEQGLPKPAARVQAEDVLIAVQGSLVLSRATGDASSFRRVVAELPDRLLLDASPARRRR